ncbi:hypothetical protein M9Y10_016912 [Tritrichomonas musculus]|uniref:Uncharacterized protein n=1 Tax=Tritrichomonas musculus TaxID=1915356 RepID=A0ABR2HYD7_9EUKA
MKYKLIYETEFDHHMCYRISIENEEVYDLLATILIKGDVIEIKNSKKKIFVSNIEYDNTAMIKINGFETDCYPESFEGFEDQKMNSYAISGKCEIEIYRFRFFEGDSGRIEKQIEIYKKSKEKSKICSDVSIQNRSFEILNQYIQHKPKLVIYGGKSFQYLEEGALKVFMITYDIYLKQENKWKDILRNENHKYKNTNIVVINENSVYYDEFERYGGIIGVISND